MKVAIGPVFTETDGPSQHIIAISKYSSHDVNEVPSKQIRNILLGNAKSQHHVKREKIYRRWTELNHLLGLYDVIHSHIDPWFTKLCMDTRSKHTKWAHTYHSMYFDEDYPDGCKDWQKEVNRIQFEVASKADARICISKWFHDILLEEHSVDTTIIPNGYDNVACQNSDGRRFSKRFGINDFLLHVGHYGPVKNPDMFIKLASKMEDIPFVMIGQYAEDHIVRKDYENSLPKNLHILGPLDHGIVLDAIAASRTLIMTSKREGIPTVLLEAMGMAKPVVAPNHSGCKEVIHSKEYGFLYDSDSLDSLAENVYKALESKNMGERAKQRVEKNFSWEVVVKQIDQVYTSLNG